MAKESDRSTQPASPPLHRLHQFMGRFGFPPDWVLVPLAALTGSLAGLVGVVYHKLVISAERLFAHFYGSRMTGMDLFLLCAAPILGGLCVGIIKQFFRRPFLSHGIPEVIAALVQRQGKMPWTSGLFTMVNSSLTIGSGGSAGQEGPIIHIGSVIGSVVGQIMKVNREYMRTLVGCGAAAGLASIFNAPIAGVMLVLEVILRDFSLRTFLPIVLASVLGVVVHEYAIGEDRAIFMITGDLLQYHFRVGELIPFILLGILSGFVGCGFTKTLCFVEDTAKRVRVPMWLKPALGAAVLGLLAVGFVLVFRRPFDAYHEAPFMGNGYPVVATLLNPGAYATLTLRVILLVTVIKLLATCLTLGSGGSGGVFAPALLIGSALGGFFGLLMVRTGMLHGTNPAVFALAGMAGLLAATVHCPLTAFILVFEITRDYATILPVMLVAMIATVIGQLLLRDSIYTLPLRHMGLARGGQADLTVLSRLSVADLPLAPVSPVPARISVAELIERDLEVGGTDHVVVDDKGRYVGMILSDDLRPLLADRQALAVLVAADLVRSDIPTLMPMETLDRVLTRLAAYDVGQLPVVDGGGTLLGILSRATVLQAYLRHVSREDRLLTITLKHD